MPLRFLLRYLGNNEQLIQKLAESYPVRRAAQIAAFFYHRGKQTGYEMKDRLKETEGFQRTRDEVNSFDHRWDSFKRTFSRELKDGFEELKKDSQRRNDSSKR